MVLTHFLTILLFTLMASAGVCQPKTPEVLIVLVVDASKSALPVMKPTIGQLREIETILSDANNGGTLAFAVIGNPKPEERHFYRLDLKKVPLVKKGTVLTDQVKYRRESQRVLLDNRRRGDQWESLYEQVVLRYKPAGLELSNVSDVFNKATLLLMEPRYRSYRKFLIFCSDLKNEPKHPGTIVPWSINLKGISRLTLIGTGASHPDPFRGLSNYIVLADVSGLVPNLQVILNP